MSKMPTSQPQRITILIVDDHPLARAGVRSILEQAPDMQVVGEADSGSAAKELVAKFRPDILLLDLIMPGVSPAEIEKWVRTNYPETTTLVLTGHDRDVYLTLMMEAGAAGYLSKNERAKTLIASIRLAARGESLFTEEQFARVRRWHEEAGEKWNSLTEREREILKLLVKGLDNKTIAETLGISLRTVAYHVNNLLGKLGLNSRQEVIAWFHKYFPEDQ